MKYLLAARQNSESASARRLRAGNSFVFVDIPSVSQCDEVQLVFGSIELINHAVIANPKAKSVCPFHVIMMKVSKPPSHVIDFLLHSPLNVQRQGEETMIKPMRTNLGRRARPGTAHGCRMRTRPASISAFPAAISSLKASVISNRSSRRFSSQSRNSSWSRCCNFRTASSICWRLLTAGILSRSKTYVNRDSVEMNF